MHVDQHGIAFHPQYDGAANQIALIGNDGGLYRTDERARHDHDRSARGVLAGAPSGAAGSRSIAATA